jgi:heat shock protein HslJ
MHSRSRSRLAVALASIIVALPTSVVAQDAPTSVTFDEELLQGTTWALSRYTVDGELADVPGDVVATLRMVDGEASGNGGCNSFTTSYEILEHLISFGEEVAVTQMLCQGAAQEIEDAYLAILPTIVAWSIADGQLVMVDPSEMPALVFGDGTFPIAVSDYLAMQAQLDDQATAIEQLELRLSNAESGGASTGTGDTATEPPAAPSPRGTVERQFAELGDDPERGLVEWNDEADDEDGYRVFARRIQCVRKGGEVVEQPSPWVRVARLPASAERYQPRHDEIVSVIEPQKKQVVGSGALYEVGVSAFNEAGQSDKVVVGAYFIAPEYSCP